MINIGIVKEVRGDTAIVQFVRQSACGGNCASCSACGTAGIKAEVKNSIGAGIGDRVRVYSKNSYILLSAFLLYIFPLLLFLLFYFISSLFFSELISLLIAVAGFILSFFILRRADRRISVGIEIIEIMR